jgi:hypothetical protein
MQLQERIERLESLLNRIDGWLRYAETKNGALLTLSSGILALFLSNGWKYEKDFSILLLIGNILIFIAIVILVLSFTPKLKALQKVERQIPEASTDLEALFRYKFVSRIYLQGHDNSA